VATSIKNQAINKTEGLLNHSKKKLKKKFEKRIKVKNEL
jgi:hypothetical protein